MKTLTFTEVLRLKISEFFRVPIVFNFYDSSASCYNLIPKDHGYTQKGWNVFFRYFDTEVSPTRSSPGGTDYNCIERFLNNVKTKKPIQNIFIWTDGYGAFPKYSPTTKYFFFLLIHSNEQTEDYIRSLGYMVRMEEKMK